MERKIGENKIDYKTLKTNQNEVCYSTHHKCWYVRIRCAACEKRKIIRV